MRREQLTGKKLAEEAARGATVSHGEQKKGFISGKLDQAEETLMKLAEEAGVNTSRDIDRPGQTFVTVEES